MGRDAKTRKAELVVIGAGPGGYTAAFAAADRGMKVTLIDAGEEPGGVCLHRGCIPSKTLLHIARLVNEAREAEEWGVRFSEPSIDLDALRGWKNQVIAKSAKGIRQLAKGRGVELIRAWARFEGSQTLVLSSERGGEPDQGRLTFEHAIVAAGSRPCVIPALDIDSPRVMYSTSALEIEDVPKSLLVVGGGYIGLELGTVYAALGSEVAVAEMTDELLPGADRDLVRFLQARLKRTFKRIYLGTSVARTTDVDNGVSAAFARAPETNVREPAPPDEQRFDRVLVAVGRRPNSEELDLERTKVKVNASGFVEVDQRLRTADEHIHAIGDIVGEPMLAHKASRQAKVAVEAIAGESSVFDARAISAVVFTDPEVAWTGLTETEAKLRGIDVKIAKFPWGASGRAAAIGRNDGLTKIIVSPQDMRLLGVGIVGVGAGELIAEPTLAIEMGATAEDVARSIHAHPTLSETIGEAAELALGTTTHILRPPR